MKPPPPEPPFLQSTSIQSRRDLGQLLEDFLRSGLETSVTVTGRSMAPFLRSGDTVTIQGTTMEAIRPGDVILFFQGLVPGGSRFLPFFPGPPCERLDRLHGDPLLTA